SVRCRRGALCQLHEAQWSAAAVPVRQRRQSHDGFSWRPPEPPVLSARGKGSLAINGRYRQKLVGLEACAADQRAIAIADPETFLGVPRLDRPAVDNADALPRVAITRAKRLADEGVHVKNIVL